MTTEDTSCIVNGIRDSLTLFDNEHEDRLSSGDFPQEVTQNHATEIDKISQVESNDKAFVNVAYDEGSHTTAVQEFYRGTNIFITGGTGFMGKLLIEKLLHSCPQINLIYMLVRNKKGKSVDTRVHELFRDPLFDRLRTEYPNFREKIHIISGDCSEPGLGLSTQDRAGIIKHVHIIFHVAATVRFDEKLEISIPTNIQGTRDLMLLCRDCRNIKVVMYVSTAYSHCYQTNIDEEFYDVPITCDRALKMAEILDEEIFTNITPLLLGKWPNTYTYTKAIAEDAVRMYGKAIPVGIFRPSIIVCTRKEPVSGWIDNLYGPTGAIVGVGMGMIRTLKINSKAVADIVPCDMTVNALVTSAWDVHMRKRCGEEDIPIYNYVSSQENPITWGEYTNINMKHCWEIPFYSTVWNVFLIPTRIHIIYKLYAFFLHILPALLIDCVFYSIGQKPRLLKTYEKLHKFTEAIAYFSTKEWKFSNSNVQQLWQKLSPEDRIIFDFNISNLCWDEFFRDSLMGVRTYLLNEDPKTLPDAVRKRYRLFWIHQFVKLMFLCLLSTLLWKMIRTLVPVMPWEIVVTF